MDRSGEESWSNKIWTQRWCWKQWGDETIRGKSSRWIRKRMTYDHECFIPLFQMYIFKVSRSTTQCFQAGEAERTVITNTTTAHKLPQQVCCTARWVCKVGVLEIPFRIDTHGKNGTKLTWNATRSKLSRKTTWEFSKKMPWKVFASWRWETVNRWHQSDAKKREREKNRRQNRLKWSKKFELKTRVRTDEDPIELRLEKNG